MHNKKLSLLKMITWCALLLVFLGALGPQPLHSGTGTKKCELWVSFKGGFTYPYDVAMGKILAKQLCPNAIVDFEIRCGKWGFVIDVAYNRFRFDFDEFDEYTYWWSANTSVRYYFKSAKIRPFLYVGPGLYFPEEGNSRLGLRGGLGLHIPLNDRIWFQLGTDFQRIFLVEDDLSFQHFHVGIDIRL